MELGASQNECHNPDVAHHSNEIDHEEQHKKDSIQLRAVGQAQEDEFGDHAGVSVSHLHYSSAQRLQEIREKRKITKDTA